MFTDVTVFKKANLDYVLDNYVALFHTIFQHMHCIEDFV